MMHSLLDTWGIVKGCTANLKSSIQLNSYASSDFLYPGRVVMDTGPSNKTKGRSNQRHSSVGALLARDLQRRSASSVSVVR